MLHRSITQLRLNLSKNIRIHLCRVRNAFVVCISPLRRNSVASRIQYFWSLHKYWRYSSKRRSSIVNAWLLDSLNIELHWSASLFFFERTSGAVPARKSNIKYNNLFCFDEKTSWLPTKTSSDRHNTASNFIYRWWRGWHYSVSTQTSFWRNLNRIWQATRAARVRIKATSTTHLL